MNCPDLRRVPKTNYRNETKTVVRHYSQLWISTTNEKDLVAKKAKYQFWSVVKDWDGRVYQTDFAQELLHERQSFEPDPTGVRGFLAMNAVNAAFNEALQRIMNKHLSGYPKSYSRTVSYITYHDQRIKTTCCLKYSCCPQTYVKA